MTTIRELILQGLQNSRKAGLKERALILSTVFGEIQTKEKQSKEVHEFTDPETVALLKSGVKVRTKTAETYTEAGHVDRAAKEELEISIIQEFLPQAATAERITELVEAEIASINEELTPRHMGRIIGAVKKIEPEADGGLLSSIVKDKMKLS